jgi:hypothetical protein
MYKLTRWLLIASTIVVYACASGPRHSPVDAELAAIHAAETDDEAWKLAQRSDRADVVMAFLDRFPDSRHAAMARLRLRLAATGALDE